MHRLVVIPTPIGNLEDITLRALRELRSASLVLAEDTRRTRKLLVHFGIKTPVLSYHEHNRRSRLPQVFTALEKGDVALVTDAGMPGISDPGSELIVASVTEGVRLDVLPGPSAVLTAVVIAGFESPGFAFVGFLPRSAAARKERLGQIASLPDSLVLFEAPHRIVRALADLRTGLGNRRTVVTRELTKVHEEVLRGRLEDIRAHFETDTPRGEFTVVVEGYTAVEPEKTDDARLQMQLLRDAGTDRKSVMDQVIRNFGISRNTAYQMWVEGSPPRDQDP